MVGRWICGPTARTTGMKGGEATRGWVMLQLVLHGWLYAAAKFKLALDAELALELGLCFDFDGQCTGRNR